MGGEAKMTQEKQTALNEIEKKKELICKTADHIWSHPELSLQEDQSAEYYCSVLENEGFEIERGICGIRTAFSASFGKGSPKIGILAEYDALSGLSQEAGSLEQKEIVPGGCGHGCGHNLLGAGSFGAVLGVKAYLEKTGHDGTVILFGCPGEEGGAAKAFMARDYFFGEEIFKVFQGVRNELGGILGACGWYFAGSPWRYGGRRIPGWRRSAAGDA